MKRIGTLMFLLLFGHSAAAEALRSATVIPAELIRMDDVGQIRQGMHAALIAVAANPLEDIGTLENVSFVMKAGQVYKLVE